MDSPRINLADSHGWSWLCVKKGGGAGRDGDQMFSNGVGRRGREGVHTGISIVMVLGSCVCMG